MRKLFAVYLSFCALIAEAQVTTRPSLRGSPSSVERQNKQGKRENLSKIKNEEMIKRFVKAGLLVRIPDGKYGVVVDSELPLNRRFCRPQTVDFIKDLGTRFEKKFGKPIQVNSCVRDIETQAELRKRNRNAAKTYGARASSHLMGSTVDIARLGLTLTEQKFIRSRLLFHEGAGRIEATEEKRQAVWHVMVFRRYKYSK